MLPLLKSVLRVSSPLHDDWTETGNLVLVPTDGGADALSVYVAWKSELGIGGDPGLEVAFAYRKHVANGSVRPVLVLAALDRPLLTSYNTQASATRRHARVSWSPSADRGSASSAPSSSTSSSSSP